MRDQELAAAEQQLADSARSLAEGIAQALPGWVVAAIQSRMPHIDPETREAAEAAGLAAAADIGGQVARLLAADIDDQRDNPLALLRQAVRYPTEVLLAAGAAPTARDAFAIERFPDDVYDLTPASFADIHPDLQTPGLEWGAAKAFVHRRRHRQSG
ncbi:hypothetical protein [Candidatus Poriferisocius sp.]|uniref:hypothetical protein n=1 Tax=Candidatus Poriferisocius sp. TaxID=3101276 RepID=UPI003B021ADC